MRFFLVCAKRSSSVCIFFAQSALFYFDSPPPGLVVSRRITAQPFISPTRPSLICVLSWLRIERSFLLQLIKRSVVGLCRDGSGMYGVLQWSANCFYESLLSNINGIYVSRSNAARLGLNISFFNSASCSSSSSFAGRKQVFDFALQFLGRRGFKAFRVHKFFLSPVNSAKRTTLTVFKDFELEFKLLVLRIYPDRWK